MAYLTREELQSHLYKGIMEEINREDYLEEYASEDHFPIIGASHVTYKSLATGIYYKWVTNTYVEIQYEDHVKTAIEAAQEEAAGYLTAYDLPAVWAKQGTERNSILLLFLKDMAVWHYIQLANPSVDMQLRLDRYEKAIKWLEKVQKGQVNPQLPYPEVTPPNEPNNYMKWGGIPRRNNNY